MSTGLVILTFKNEPGFWDFDFARIWGKLPQGPRRLIQKGKEAHPKAKQAPARGKLAVKSYFTRIPQVYNIPSPHVYTALNVSTTAWHALIFRFERKGPPITAIQVTTAARGTIQPISRYFITAMATSCTVPHLQRVNYTQSVHPLLLTSRTP